MSETSYKVNKGDYVKILPANGTEKYNTSACEGLYGRVLDKWDRSGEGYYLLNVPCKKRDLLEVVYEDQLEVVTEGEYMQNTVVTA